jgi:L-lactate permease
VAPRLLGFELGLHPAHAARIALVAHSARVVE